MGEGAAERPVLRGWGQIEKKKTKEKKNECNALLDVIVMLLHLFDSPPPVLLVVCDCCFLLPGGLFCSAASESAF